MKIETGKSYAGAPVDLGQYRARLHIAKRSEVAGNVVGGWAKRFFDIALVVLSLPFILPLLLGIALLIKINMGGPVLYGHKRIGLDGKVFRCWKFRTMVQDGDAVLAEHLALYPAERELWTTQRKLMNDPRVTRLGGILRKLSIDELPQLLNILVGEMSIVGPRPVVADELAMYGRCAQHYLRTRPGLTGLWQVSGRSNTTYQHRVTLDRVYVSRWSILLDAWIILRTVPAVLASRGAV